MVIIVKWFWQKQCHKPCLYHKFMVKLGMVYCFTHIRWFDSSDFRLGLVTFALLLGLGHICSESFLSGQWFFRFFIRTFCFSWPSATFLHGVSSPWIDQLTGGHYSKWLNETGLVEAFAFDGTHQVQHLPGFDRCPIMSPRGWWKIWGITHEIRNVNAVLEKKLGNMIHQMLGCESHVTFQSLWLLGEHGNWNSMTTCHRPLLPKCENHRKPGCKALTSFDSYPQNPKIDKTYTSADVLISPL